MRPDYQTARQLERQEQECRRRMRGVARKHMFGRSLPELEAGL